MNPAPNLVLVGPMGAGKSSIGRRLAERFGLAFVDVDGEIEARTGANIPTIFECEGEAGFRAREAAVLADLLRREGLVLATGGGAVLDPRNRALMRERGFVVHLKVSLERQLERLARDRLSADRAPLYAEVADLGFDTDHLIPPQAAGRIARLLDERWTRPATPTPQDHTA